MKRLMYAIAAIAPLVSAGCNHCNHFLDATFCRPCHKGQLFGGCWGGQCGYGQEGCSDCVRGQGEQIGEGEVIHEGGAYEGAVYEGDGMAGGDCNCPDCRGRRHGMHGHGMHGRHGGHGLFGNGGMGGGGMQGASGAQMAGGPPTAQVAYPYYTTRAPRDFLNPNPRSIGR